MLKHESPHSLGTATDVETVPGSGIKCTIDLEIGPEQEISNMYESKQDKFEQEQNNVIENLTFTEEDANSSLHHMLGQVKTFDFIIGIRAITIFTLENWKIKRESGL